PDRRPPRRPRPAADNGGTAGRGRRDGTGRRPEMGILRARGIRVPFAARIVAAMLLGVALGELLGRRAEPLGQLGAVVIDLIKALAGPLLLFAVLDAFL